MRSYILAGLTLLSILLILSFSGVAMTENGSMAKNMTLPMNTTVPMNMTAPMNMKMPMSTAMNMPNRTGNGSMSMSMVMFQHITLNIVLVQNLTEITNTIIPASINPTNGNKTNALNAVKSSAKAT